MNTTPTSERRYDVEGYGNNIGPDNAAISMWLSEHSRKALAALEVGESDHLYFNASGQSTQAKVTRIK